MEVDRMKAKTNVEEEIEGLEEEVEKIEEEVKDGLEVETCDIAFRMILARTFRRPFTAAELPQCD